MSFIFNQNLAKNENELRIMKKQWKDLQNIRRNSNADVQQYLSSVENAARTPADAYREFDSTSKIDMVPAGEFSTLTRLIQKSKPINIGKQLYEYRKISDMDEGQSSMSGQTAILLDHTAVSYGGTVVPIHDKGFGRNWREIEAMRSDGYDALVDDAREAERGLMKRINNYLWNGDANLVFKGVSWLGIKGDPTVATATLALDLSASASTGEAIRNEVSRVRDILYITNNCTNPLRLVVSREIMSNWERPFSTADSGFKTIFEMIKNLRGIAEIYEDPALSGNELAFFWDDQMGFHPVTGMPISTYAIPRHQHNSDHNFVKWAAVGFVSKTDFSNRKCVLYAS